MWILHGWCLWFRLPLEVCTVPSLTPYCASDLEWIPPHLHGSARLVGVGWRGDWSCCCRGIPHSALEGLFLFEKILLLNPDAPYKEGPVLSHSPPLQLDQGLSGSGPDMAQLSTLPGWHAQSQWVYHFVLIPLPATSSNPVSLGSAQVLFVRRGSRKVSSLPGVLQQAQKARAWGCSHPGPCAGPRDLFFLKQSPYHLFFQCPLYFLVSYLHKRWGTALFLSRSSRCFTCVQGEVDSIPTYLATIFTNREINF